MQALPLGWLPPLADLPKRRQLLFANVSFPDNIRCQTLPSVIESKTFRQSMKSLFDEVHGLVKERLAADRKSKKASEKQRMFPESETNDDGINQNDAIVPWSP